MSERSSLALIAAISAWLAMPGEAGAGAWIREPGHAFVMLGSSFSSSQDHLSKKLGLIQHGMSFSLFAEVGLENPKMDLVVQLPYVILSNTYAGEARYLNQSLGDAHFQLDRALLAQIHLTGGLELKIPLYETIAGREQFGRVEVDKKPFFAANFPEIGNGEAELTPKLLYGTGFSTSAARGGWFTAELGFRARLGVRAQGAYVTAGVGLWIWPRHLALGVSGHLAADFGAPVSPKLPNGEEPLYALYFSGSCILTGAPWLPWLKVLGSLGALPLASRQRTGMDAGLGVAVDY